MTETEKIDLRMRIHALEEERKTLRSALDRLKPALDKFSIIEKLALSDEMEAHIGIHRAVRDALGCAAGDVTTEFARAMRSERDALQGLVDDIESESGHCLLLDDEDHEAPRLSDWVRDIVKERDALRAEVKRLTFARDTISDERDVQRDVSKELRAEVERLRAELAAKPWRDGSTEAFLTEQAATLRAEVERLRHQHADLREALDCAPDEATLDSVKAWRCEVRRLHEEADALRLRIRELEKERDALLAEFRLMERKVITCGVAATHPDPTLTRTKKCYAETWNSPQAEYVRKLREERDALRAENEKLMWNLAGVSTICCAESLDHYIAGSDWQRPALEDAARIVRKVMDLRAEVERLRAGEDDRFDREDFQNE